MPGDPEQCGRFKIVFRLGAGGMGIAYLAETPEGQRAVVKMVQLDLADDPDARRRFRHEMLASLTVKSRLVPDTLASDLSAERQWVAIEYINGPTLAELVAPTSRGVRLGSPAEEVWAAYPEAPGDRLGNMYPDLAPGVPYTIGIMDGRVELLVLQSERQDCAA